MESTAIEKRTICAGTSTRAPRSASVEGKRRRVRTLRRRVDLMGREVKILTITVAADGRFMFNGSIKIARRAGHSQALRTALGEVFCTKRATTCTTAVPEEVAETNFAADDIDGFTLKELRSLTSQVLNPDGKRNFYSPENKPTWFPQSIPFVPPTGVKGASNRTALMQKDLREILKAYVNR